MSSLSAVTKSDSCRRHSVSDKPGDVVVGGARVQKTLDYQWTKRIGVGSADGLPGSKRH
jgi:hypothetical protein